MLKQLIHNGIIVLKLPVPSRLELVVRGERRELSPKQIEMAMAWAKKQGTSYVEDPVFARNFMEDFSAELGVNPLNCPVEVAIAAFDWGRYLGAEALEQGVDVCVSSWARMAPNTFPAMAKAGANYMNAQLIKMEALRHGYVEGIALDSTGYVSEGSGENIFAVRDGVLYTPPLTSSILPGITRDSVMVLARDLGHAVVEQVLPREFLYVADEVFFSGTAAEITPIRSIDGIRIGAGRRGPITSELQAAFFAIVEGRAEDRFRWLTAVGG